MQMRTVVVNQVIAANSPRFITFAIVGEHPFLCRKLISAEKELRIPHETPGRELFKYFVDIQKCSDTRVIQFNNTKGIIHGYKNKRNFTGQFSVCYFQISAPNGFYIKAFSQILGENGRGCESDTVMIASNTTEFQHVYGKWGCNKLRSESKSPLLLMPGNVMFVKVQDTTVPRDFWLFFEGINENLRESFFVVYESELSGYITSHGMDMSLSHARGLIISYVLHLPRKHTVMLSSKLFALKSYGTNMFCKHIFLELFILVSKHKSTRLWKICQNNFIPARVYPYSLQLRFVVGYNTQDTLAFKFVFSFHPIDDLPHMLPSGLFNCSKNYETFRQHLDCNVRVECQNHEDEFEKCPFSSPACRGSYFLQGRCLRYVHTGRGVVKWHQAREQCQAKGGDLAVLKTMALLKTGRDMLSTQRASYCVHVGLQSASFYSGVMYRKTLRWLDGTTGYNIGMYVAQNVSIYEKACGVIFTNGYKRLSRGQNCYYAFCDSFLCEIPVHVRGPSSKKIHFSKLESNNSFSFQTTRSFVKCHGNHMTHDFLQCDAESGCGADHISRLCIVNDFQKINNAYSSTHSDHSGKQIGSQASKPQLHSGNKDVISIDLFHCHDFGGSIPYTLVCDFRRDCVDDSDEEYCKHKEDESKFSCDNGRLITSDKVCDWVADCLDESDEGYCENHFHSFTIQQEPPVILEMNGRGGFTTVALTADDVCPETHFRCPGKDMYCMPVFLRCNDVKDCPHGEDELGCDTASCPGYYRCRRSTVCLHPSHVCDERPQCPQRDDELLCNATCPSECQCQGLAFVCHRPFSAEKYPELRYLYARGSGITPVNVSSNFYLIYLNLAACGLETWPVVDLSNLQRLGLSYNTISTIHLEAVRLLSNLRYLNVKCNPLANLVRSSSQTQQTSLTEIDLTQTRLPTFDSEVFVNFPFIELLNLSYSSLIKINENGFKYLPKLKHLDMTGCKIEEFHGDLFRGLMYLRTIKAENYKLCCKTTLPRTFNVDFCFSPSNEVSSCEDLLRSNFFRFFLWTIGIFSVIGNAGCFVLRIISQNKTLFQSGYTAFVTNLSISDFMMGFYLVIIGTADQLYRGQYLWNEATWKESNLCTIAGFLSFVSSEVSAFIICLITIDRFIVLRFPFSTLRFKGRSAVMASGMAWLAGIILAVVPLFSVFSHWRFYGDTGICIPLPVSENAFNGQGYAFGVLIVFNFLLFAFIAVGQTSIYWSIKTNSIDNVSSTNTLRDFIIARRLFTVVVSDFLCWFPVGVVGLIANNGTPVPGEVNVAMAIFVLPLNSALNPFLYTLNIIMEKRRKAREAKVLLVLQNQNAV